MTFHPWQPVGELPLILFGLEIRKTKQNKIKYNITTKTQMMIVRKKRKTNNTKWSLQTMSIVVCVLCIRKDRRELLFIWEVHSLNSHSSMSIPTFVCASVVVVGMNRVYFYMPFQILQQQMDKQIVRYICLYVDVPTDCWLEWKLSSNIGWFCWFITISSHSFSPSVSRCWSFERVAQTANSKRIKFTVAIILISYTK